MAGEELEKDRRARASEEGKAAAESREAPGSDQRCLPERRCRSWREAPHLLLAETGGSRERVRRTNPRQRTTEDRAPEDQWGGWSFSLSPLRGLVQRQRSETEQERGRGLGGGLCDPEAARLFGMTKVAASGVLLTPPPHSGAPWPLASAASAALPPGAPAPAPWPPAGPPRPGCQ